MHTTIQISKELLEKLAIMKMHEKESYENIIWDLIEDRMEFSEQTKRNIEQSEKEIKRTIIPITAQKIASPKLLFKIEISNIII